MLFHRKRHNNSNSRVEAGSPTQLPSRPTSCGSFKSSSSSSSSSHLRMGAEGREIICPEKSKDSIKTTQCLSSTNNINCNHLSWQCNHSLRCFLSNRWHNPSSTCFSNSSKWLPKCNRLPQETTSIATFNLLHSSSRPAVGTTAGSTIRMEILPLSPRGLPSETTL